MNRSSLFSLKSSIFFDCNVSYSLAYKWSLFRNDTGQYIDLSSNPTWQTTELVMQPFQLLYGLYEFVIQVRVSVTSVTRSTSKFVLIMPTGIAVFGIPNGVSGLLIGSLQSVVLDPRTNSIDLDRLYSPSLLHYTFYCQMYSTNTLTNLASNITDLLTYKMNSFSNQTCFKSPGKFL